LKKNNMNRDYMKEIGQIKFLMEKGQLSYEEAKKEAQPIIDEMNKIAERIAKKYKRKAHKFKFISLMR